MRTNWDIRLTLKEKKIVELMAEKGPRTGYDLFRRHKLVTEEGWRRIRKHLLSRDVIYLVRTSRRPDEHHKKLYWLAPEGIRLALVLAGRKGIVERAKSIDKTYESEGNKEGLTHLFARDYPDLFFKLQEPRPFLPSTFTKLADELTDGERRQFAEAMSKYLPSALARMKSKAEFRELVENLLPVVSGLLSDFLDSAQTATA